MLQLLTKRNYYRAQLDSESSELKVLSLTLDCLCLPKPVKLVKIDVEGQELAVLQGMEGILQKDRPLLIIEDNTLEIDHFLNSLDYIHFQLPNSPNRVFHHKEISISL